MDLFYDVELTIKQWNNRRGAMEYNSLQDSGDRQKWDYQKLSKPALMIGLLALAFFCLPEPYKAFIIKKKNGVINWIKSFSPSETFKEKDFKFLDLKYKIIAQRQYAEGKLRIKVKVLNKIRPGSEQMKEFAFFLWNENGRTYEETNVWIYLGPIDELKPYAVATFDSKRLKSFLQKGTASQK